MIETQIDDLKAHANVFSFCFAFSVAVAETSGPEREGQSGTRFRT